MGKQTSRMYGIKVKERVNYYEFGDIQNGWAITLSFTNNKWTVKAGVRSVQDPQHLLPKGDCDWWMNGVRYTQGDTIVEFNEGEEVTFNIMEQHRDETPYTNYHYDIFGNAAINARYGDKDVKYVIVNDPDSTYAFKVHRYINGVLKDTKGADSEAIKKYKRTYNKKYPIFNLLFDWHGMNPETGYPQMSFECISNSNYIKYEGNPKSKNSTIVVWQAASSVRYDITDETNKHQVEGSLKDDKPVVALVKRHGGSTLNTANKNRETIMSDVYHDHKEAYYNGHYHKAMYLVYDNAGIDGCWKKNIKGTLALTYADPYWFLMTTKSGVYYNGTTYEARKKIRNWTPSTPVNMNLSYTETRRKSKENLPDETIIYDVQSTASSDDVTVIKQIMTYVIDPITGRKQKHYEDVDTLTFNQSTPTVNFHTIQFKFNANTDKWTIYSKCDFIKFSSRTYPKNRAILSFLRTENIHIEITDETNKYEVKSITTFNIATPPSNVTTTYEIHTSELTYEMKVVKNNNGTEEPWISVKSYEAEYVPKEIDDISFLYINKERRWELYSNSDDLYYNGTNYKIGELLGSWGYLDIYKISGITIAHPSSDSIQVTTHTTSSTGVVKNNDIDEDIAWWSEDEPDFNVGYSYYKGIWVIKALRDIWCEGILYTEGQTVRTFKTKIAVSPFTLLATHQDPEEELPENISYSLYAEVDAINGTTALTVSSMGKPDQVFSDKDISKNGEEAMLFTKDKLKSMYGYIWKKLGSPGPTPTPDFDLLISISYGYRLGNTYLSSYLMRYDLRSTTINSSTSYSNYGSVYLFYLLSHKTSHGTRIFAVMDSYTTPMPSWGNLRLAWTDNFGGSWTFNMTNFESTTEGNAKYFDIHVCDRTHVYQILKNDGYGIIRFIKYSILGNGDLSKDIDEMITADPLREGYAFWFPYNIGKSSYGDRSYMFDNYCVRVEGRMGEQGLLNGFYDYDLLNHSLITTYHDAVETFQEYLNTSYASYSNDGNVETWTYFANYWYSSYDDGTIYETTDDIYPPGIRHSGKRREDPTNWLELNHNCSEITVDSISFSYFKIKIRRSTYTSGTGWTNETIEDIGNVVIRYDHINKNSSTYTISDSQMIDLAFKSEISREYRDNWYGFKSFQDLIYLTRFDKSTGTCETIKTFEPGSYILVKYFDNSSSYENKFIKLHLITDIADREYLTYDSTNTYRCKIRPEELNIGGYETYSTVAAVHNINYRDSASNCNDKFIFKVANGDRDFKGAIFVFDNINLEGLNVAFRDDYYY